MGNEGFCGNCNQVTGKTGTYDQYIHIFFGFVMFLIIVSMVSWIADPPTNVNVAQAIGLAGTMMFFIFWVILWAVIAVVLYIRSGKCKMCGGKNYRPRPDNS